LRQQLAMAANRDNKRHRFRPSERIFWVWLFGLWPDCIAKDFDFTGPGKHSWKTMQPILYQ
jgi:hypothetical protein